MYLSHSEKRHRQWLQRAAWLCAVMVLAVTSLSAFIRLSRAGVGCAPWPQCYGAVQSLTASAQATTQSPTPAIALARTAHRVLASAALVLALGLLMGAWRWGLWAGARMALGLVVLALFLGGLGAATGASGLPAVALGNVLGGLLMFALAVRLAVSLGMDGRRHKCTALAWGAGGLFALVLVQAGLGVLVSTTHAGQACPATGGCAVPWAQEAAWAALNPWLHPEPALQISGGPGSLAHMLHRSVGGLATLALWVLAWRAWRRGLQALALILGLLAPAMVLLGAAVVWLGLPLSLILLHSLGAALLLALLLALTLAQRTMGSDRAILG